MGEKITESLVTNAIADELDRLADQFEHETDNLAECDRMIWGYSNCISVLRQRAIDLRGMHGQEQGQAGDDISGPVSEVSCNSERVARDG